MQLSSLHTCYMPRPSYPSIIWLVGSFPSGIVASHSFHCCTTVSCCVSGDLLYVMRSRFTHSLVSIIRCICISILEGLKQRVRRGTARTSQFSFHFPIFLSLYYVYCLCVNCYVLLPPGVNPTAINL
jgi:hypothetical protein